MGAGLYMWYQKSSRVYLSGRALTLDPKVEYEFFFYASFPSEANARRCAESVTYPGLKTSVGPTPNHKFWSIDWSIVARAHGSSIRALHRKLEGAATEHGGKMVNVSASKLGATITVA